jgi:hypothetical protein
MTVLFHQAWATTMATAARSVFCVTCIMLLLLVESPNALAGDSNPSCTALFPADAPVKYWLKNVLRNWVSSQNSYQAEPQCGRQNAFWISCTTVCVDVPSDWHVIETITSASRGPGCQFYPHAARIESNEKPSLTSFSDPQITLVGKTQHICRTIGNWATGTHAPYGMGVSGEFRIRAKSTAPTCKDK